MCGGPEAKTGSTGPTKPHLSDLTTSRCRVDYFGLPELLTLTPSETPAFIGLQAGAGQLLDPLIVEPQGRIRWIGNGTGLALTDLAVPQRGVLTFAELSCTAPAAYPANPSLVTDLVRSVALAGPANPSFFDPTNPSLVVLSCLTVAGALMIDAGQTCYWRSVCIFHMVQDAPGLASPLWRAEIISRYDRESRSGSEAFACMGIVSCTCLSLEEP